LRNLNGHFKEALEEATQRDERLRAALTESFPDCQPDGEFSPAYFRRLATYLDELDNANLSSVEL
jgi:hypothetical protein